MFGEVGLCRSGMGSRGEPLKYDLAAFKARRKIEEFLINNFKSDFFDGKFVPMDIVSASHDDIETVHPWKEYLFFQSMRKNMIYLLCVLVIASAVGMFVSLISDAYDVKNNIFLICKLAWGVSCVVVVLVIWSSIMVYLKKKEAVRFKKRDDDMRTVVLKRSDEIVVLEKKGNGNMTFNLVLTKNIESASSEKNEMGGRDWLLKVKLENGIIRIPNVSDGFDLV